MLGSLNRVTTGAGPWVGQEARLRWSAPALGGAVCRDHAQCPVFAPGTSEMAVGSWPFCILLSVIAPTAHACSHFSLLIVSVYSVAGGDVCPGASTLVRVPGPSLSHYQRLCVSLFSFVHCLLLPRPHSEASTPQTWLPRANAAHLTATGGRLTGYQAHSLPTGA